MKTPRLIPPTCHNYCEVKERERELEKRTFFTFLQRGFIQNLSELILFIITLNLICFRLFFFLLN